MPADAGVDDGCTRLLDFLGQMHHLFPGTAVFNQIQHGQAVNQDKVLAHSFTNPANDFDGQTNAVFVTATPTVSPMVGMRHNELVNEVTL